MTTLTSLLRNHHQHCDTLFSESEQGLANGDWTDAQRRFSAFQQEVERHFRCEEDTLFPAFEAATGMTSGPTQVMRMEHAQMRGLLAQMASALHGQDEDEFSGAAETLLILMQQHNMKEENILYPMCDQHVAAPVVEEISTILKGDAS